MSNNLPTKATAVVAVIVRRGKFLVIQRSQHVIAPGKYCFPGGSIEPPESESEAVCRELHEELSAKVGSLRRIWQSVTPWDVSLGWWQVVLDTPDDLHPSPQEVAEVKWLSTLEMLAMPDLLESNRQFLDALQRGEVEVASEKK